MTAITSPAPLAGRPLRLLLADDHAIVREGYRRLIERRPQLQLVAEAETAEDALLRFREHRPDVAVIDLNLPEMGGIELIRRLRQRDPEARVLVFSMHRDALHARQALAAGALGYVTKACPPSTLLDAILRVGTGQRSLSPDIAEDLALASLPGEGADDAFARLSPREFEILRLLLAGRSAEEIATVLHISPKTAQNCHYQIKAKLGARNDIELTRMALAAGVA
ncbi:response regulator [Derxia gummosa]|uniref:Response regulator n=1 Tax=Derxia gummosa DSM 723 TaxID=1121388 RepID=A0A9U5GJT7_9BURK|nr:response regulator transcription factor [Derxia gummosa]